MDRDYEVYCLVDPIFYDSPLRASWDNKEFTAAKSVPGGWARHDFEDWRALQPVGVELPKQGWKVHVSACLSNADAILSAVWEYCVPRRIPFKFIRNQPLLLLRNAKNASRAASGKFVTIYPADEAQLDAVCRELGEALAGQEGPYILSDLRLGAGPLFVRYGGFAERWCVGPGGEQVLAIEDSGGALVPDRRIPTFQPPAWITLPPFLEPHLAARNGATVDEFPFRITAALHFSNAGGVYAGVERDTGRPLVIKEARPHAGLTFDGADAVARLVRERDILGKLAGLACVPAVRGFFQVGEHHFLAIDRIEAKPLRRLIVARYPLILPEAGAAEVAAYTDWAVSMYRQVEEAVSSVHRRGVVIGDLHPHNILIRSDGSVVLIDFEVAAEASERRRPALGAPGFGARGAEGFDIDRYALASLALFFFLPLTALVSLDPAKATQLAGEIEDLFPTPAGFLSEATKVLGAFQAKPGQAPSRPCAIEPDPRGWASARERMARAILAAASPSREDRLFPGDIAQFKTGGLNLAHGAAGVLYALAATGAGRYPDHEDWLATRAKAPTPGVRLGFYDGLHGVAYALGFLGRREDALAVLEICVDELTGKLAHFSLDLSRGLAGIGLNLAHFWQLTGDAALKDQALAVAQLCADRLGDEDAVATLSGGEHPHAGLIRGSSGPALFFIRLAEAFGDTGWLDLAATALRQDLRRCVTRPEGTLEVNEGWRTMPYLADGSVGIGIVLADYLAHRHDDRFAEAAKGIRLAATCPFTVEPGLFYGKAGMILYLSRGLEPGSGGADPVIAAHIRRLSWHGIDYRGGLAFPGEQLLRLSMDLASGTAGVLLAMGAALHDAPVALPFLSPGGTARHQQTIEIRQAALARLATSAERR